MVVGLFVGLVLVALLVAVWQVVLELLVRFREWARERLGL